MRKQSWTPDCNDACDPPHSYGLSLQGAQTRQLFLNLSFSYMQSNWFTPLNMCQVSDVQPSITAQQQLRLNESWCCSAGPQGVLVCQHLQSNRERAEKPVHRSVPWSPGLWAFSKHHWFHWNHLASNYSGFVHTAHKSGLVFKSDLVDWLSTVFICLFIQCR